MNHNGAQRRGDSSLRVRVDTMRFGMTMTRCALIAFAFSFTLGAFGGITITVKTETMAGCLDARAATRKQLMLAGLPVTTLTACEYVQSAE